MVISFAWTTPALVAGQKTCTRRDWDPRYATRFRSGQLVQAYDRQPRYRGKPVAIIRLTADPVLQNTRDIPEEDYKREGFEFLQAAGIKVDGLLPQALWVAWRIKPRDMWVVRFEVVKLLQPELMEMPR